MEGPVLNSVAVSLLGALLREGFWIEGLGPDS